MAFQSATMYVDAIDCYARIVSFKMELNYRSLCLSVMRR